MTADPARLLNRLRALLRAGDSLAAKPLIENLRQQPNLLRDLHGLAERDNDVPRVLYDLLLEEDGTQVVLRYGRASDLEAGLWILPELERPGHSFAPRGAAQLDRLAERHSDCRSGCELAQILGQNYGFAGNQRNYHHPHNCFLPTVLELRMGMPIALVSLWLLLCRRLRIAARPLALPGHVFGACEDGFVDCFSGGVVVGMEALDAVARAAGEADASSYLAGASDRQILQRCALNVAVGYRQRGDSLRALLATSMAGPARDE